MLNMTHSSSRYAYNISLKEVTQILTRVLLEYPFQQQGPELTASQYVALLLPVSVFLKKKKKTPIFMIDMIEVYPYFWFHCLTFSY